MTRRFWLALGFGAPVFVLTMAEMIGAPGLTRALGMPAVNWIGLAFATPVVFLGRLAVLRARLGVARHTAARTCSR